jgi:hypothetical protein
MAAPFNFDTGNPTNTTDVSAFPANEQAFRAVVAAASAVVVDATTGLGPLVQSYTTTQKNALVSPPTGLLVYDTTIPSLSLQTGTPASPTWTSV